MVRAILWMCVCGLWLAGCEKTTSAPAPAPQPAAGPATTVPPATTPPPATPDVVEPQAQADTSTAPPPTTAPPVTAPPTASDVVVANVDAVDAVDAAPVVEAGPPVPAAPGAPTPSFVAMVGELTQLGVSGVAAGSLNPDSAGVVWWAVPTSLGMQYLFAAKLPTRPAKGCKHPIPEHARWFAFDGETPFALAMGEGLELWMPSVLGPWGCAAVQLDGGLVAVTQLDAKSGAKGYRAGKPALELVENDPACAAAKTFVDNGALKSTSRSGGSWKLALESGSLLEGRWGAREEASLRFAGEEALGCAQETVTATQETAWTLTPQGGAPEKLYEHALPGEPGEPRVVRVRNTTPFEWEKRGWQLKSADGQHHVFFSTQKGARQVKGNVRNPRGSVGCSGSFDDAAIALRDTIPAKMPLTLACSSGIKNEVTLEITFLHSLEKGGYPEAAYTWTGKINGETSSQEGVAILAR